MGYNVLLEHQEIVAKFYATEEPIILYDEEDYEQEDTHEIDDHILQIADDLLNQMYGVKALLRDMIKWLVEMQTIVKKMALSEVAISLIQNFKGIIETGGIGSQCLDIHKEMVKKEEQYKSVINGYLEVCLNELEVLKQRITDIELEIEYGSQESLIDSINIFFAELNDFEYMGLLAYAKALNDDFKASQEGLLERIRGYITFCKPVNAFPISWLRFFIRSVICFSKIYSPLLY